MSKANLKIIFRITLTYTLVGMAWILGSDWLLAQFIRDTALFARISVYKGWAYVVITAGLLAVLLTSELRKIEIAEKRLRENEGRFRLLYEQAPLSYQSMTAEGILLDVNPAWTRLMGFSVQEALGKNFFDLVHPKHQALFREHIQGAMQTRLCGQLELELVHKSGRPLVVEIIGSVNQRQENGQLITRCILVDLTEQINIQKSILQQQEEFQQIIHTVPAMILYFNKENIIQRANRAASEARGLSVDEMVGKKSSDIFPLDYEAQNEENQEIIRTGIPILGRVVEYPGIDGSNHWGRVDKLPYRDREGKSVGVVVFVNDITDRFLHERALETLVALGAELREANSQQELVQITLNKMQLVLGVAGATLALRNSGADDLYLRGSVGKWAGVKDMLLPKGKGLSWHVVQTSQPFWDNQIDQRDDFAPSEQLKGLKAVACVPLIAEHQTIGAIWIGKYSQIPEADYRLLLAIADLVANALHRASLYEQTQQRLQRISALHYVDMAITASFDWQVTMNVLLSQACLHLHTQAASILLIDPSSNLLVHGASTGFSGMRIYDTRLRIGESLAGKAAQNRETFLITDLRKISNEELPRKFLQEENFSGYCATPLIVKGQVKGVMELFTRELLHADGEWREFVEMLAAQAAIAIDNAELFERLQRSSNELMLAYDATITGWSRAMELRDAETQGHALRLSDLTIKVARKMGVNEDQIPHLRRGVLLHDIGKMAIPDSILLKPGPLDDAEWQIMRRHPVYAYELLSPIEYLRPALDIPYLHHENWDGSGYPHGLKGEAIPLAARIFAVLDRWDALTHDRPYRKAWSARQTVEYLQSIAGKELDPRVVEVFLSVLREEGLAE